jgi:hypothetical protein
MDTIAPLDTTAIESWLAQNMKFRRLMREAGLPEEIYQKAIDDKDFRTWLAETCQEKLQVKITEPTPSTSWLTQTFEVEVDYDDPENLVISKCGGEIYYVDKTLKPRHFPIRGKGKVVKKMRYLEFDYMPTTQEILDETERHGVLNPDFADTRAFHKKNSGERSIAPVVSICGGFEGRGDSRCVVYVCARVYGLGLDFYRLQRQWGRRVRVLVLSE